MNLVEYMKNRPRGEVSRLAKAINAHSPDLSMWAHKKRPVPVHFASSIEIATQGQVTRKDLRPNDWHRIWPELAEGEAA